MGSTKPQPRHSKEELARQGDEMFERDIRAHIAPGNEDRFVLIDVDSGAYEIDADERAASDRLLARRPAAQVWMRRVGSPYARRFGTRLRSWKA
jgi:hypothetical protein